MLCDIALGEKRALKLMNALHLSFTQVPKKRKQSDSRCWWIIDYDNLNCLQTVRITQKQKRLHRVCSIIFRVIKSVKIDSEQLYEHLESKKWHHRMVFHELLWEFGGEIRLCLTCNHFWLHESISIFSTHEDTKNMFGIFRECLFYKIW